MAIAYDTHTTPDRTVGTSHTFSHTCSGDNRLLIVCGHDANATSSTVTGVTYNGTAMTKADEVRVPGDRMITIWYLVNPDSGANNVVVSSSSSQNLRFSSISYTGVKQTSPVEDSANNTSSGTSSISISCTPTTDNSWMVAFFKDTTGSLSYTTSTGDTERYDADAGGHCLYDTGEAITPAGVNTITVDNGNTGAKGAIALTFAPAGGGGSDTRNALLLGGGIS